ncbi:hypothetical protein Tco_1077426 [Tanacetum coccineum]
MEYGIVMNVEVIKSVNELLFGKEEPMPIWGNTYLVFDLVLNVVNCVKAFNFENDGSHQSMGLIEIAIKWESGRLDVAKSARR